MRIWLGTWNCEQQFPTLAQLTAWANHGGAAGGAGTCDLVVMTFQECARNHFVPTIGGHAPIVHLTANGQTKNVENCQSMLVWEAVRGVNGRVIHTGQSHVDVTERTFKRKVKFWAEYGKGSANNIIWYALPANGGVIGIVLSGAHLDSKNAQKRTAQVNGAENSAPALSNGPLPWDVQFLMGDLNFRVNKVGNHNLASFCHMAAVQPQLLFADDSMGADPILGAGGNWTFPPPIAGAPGPAAGLYLPTYKKRYKAAAAAAALNAAQALPANPTVNIPALYDLETDKNGAVKEGSRAGQYDFGWLDRIGYRINGGSPRQVTHRYSGSPPDLILSDHAPVYSVFEIV